MDDVDKIDSVGYICKSCRSIILTIVTDWQDEDQLILFRYDKDCTDPLIDPEFQSGIVTCFMRLLWYMRRKVNELENRE